MRFGAIGCGGLIALVIVFSLLGALLGGGSEDTASSPIEEGEQERGVEEAAEPEPEPEPAEEPEPTPAPAPEPETQDVIFRVTGDPGLQFQGSISTGDTSQSVQGTTPQDFPLEVDTGLFSGDIVSANAQNMAGSGTLVTQVIRRRGGQGG